MVFWSVKVFSDPVSVSLGKGTSMMVRIGATISIWFIVSPIEVGIGRNFLVAGITVR